MNINYATMSDAELKDYFLKHRNNKAALQAYLDRINQNSQQVIATSDDPNFGEVNASPVTCGRITIDKKIQAAIIDKLQNKSN